MRRTIAMIALTTAIVLLGASAAFAWTPGVVDTNDADTVSSLGVSMSNVPWVAWRHFDTDDLFWSRWSGSAWTTTQVEGVGTTAKCLGGIGPVAGFKPTDGSARIATACRTVNQNPGTIKWTHRSKTGDWSTQLIATLQATGGTCSANPDNLSLAFSASGAPALAFGDDNTQSVYWTHQAGTHRSSNRWVTELVASTGSPCVPTGPTVSIAYDPATDSPAIAWNSNMVGKLNYSVYDSGSGTWATSTVPGVGTMAGAPSLAFAPDGTAWIAFAQGDLNASHLEVASLAGATWTLTNVDSVSTRTGASPSIAMKGSLPRIASYDVTDGDLRFASYDGTIWSLSTIESTNQVGVWPSLAFSAGGRGFVSYTDITNQDIRWAHTA